MLIILLAIILFHLAAIILLLVATIYNVSVQAVNVRDRIVRALTSVSLRGVGVVGGDRGQAGGDLHRPVVLL